MKIWEVNTATSNGVPAVNEYEGKDSQDLNGGAVVYQGGKQVRIAPQPHLRFFFNAEVMDDWLRNHLRVALDRSKTLTATLEQYVGGSRTITINRVPAEAEPPVPTPKGV